MAMFKALETTVLPVLLRIFHFEMYQQFQVGKQQHISITVSFAGQAICPFQGKSILWAQLLKERVTYGKSKAKATEIFSEVCHFGNHQAQEFPINCLGK